MTTSTRRLGRHTSLDEGFTGAFKKAHLCGYNAVQVFPGNPKGWHHEAMDADLAVKTRSSATMEDIHPVVIHAPYIINLASSEARLGAQSEKTVKNSVARAHEIGAAFVVVHAGSHKGMGEDIGISKAAARIEAVVPGASPNVTVLLENSANSGNVLAGTIEGLCAYLGSLPESVGTCIDTAHLWGAGYDLGDERVIELLIDTMARSGVLPRLHLLHLNDSAVPLGSRRDVHAHIGSGMIPMQGLMRWATHPALITLPVIVETPGEEDLDRERGRLNVVRLLLAGEDAEAQAQALILHETATEPVAPDATDA